MQCNSLNVKLSNSQLHKLKPEIEDGIKPDLQLSPNMIGDYDDKINFPHELLLTNSQVATLRTAFANKSSKTQRSKLIQYRRTSWYISWSIT